MIVEIELHAQTAKQSQLEQDQPKAAREEISRQLSSGPGAQRSMSACSGQQKENRCTEMGYPACKEQSWNEREFELDNPAISPISQPLGSNQSGGRVDTHA